jgi:hypothetical protein
MKRKRRRVYGWIAQVSEWYGGGGGGVGGGGSVGGGAVRS